MKIRGTDMTMPKFKYIVNYYCERSFFLGFIAAIGFAFLRIFPVRNEYRTWPEFVEHCTNFIAAISMMLVLTMIAFSAINMKYSVINIMFLSFLSCFVIFTLAYAIAPGMQRYRFFNEIRPTSVFLPARVPTNIRW